jgi:hypothetical protein
MIVLRPSEFAVETTKKDTYSGMDDDVNDEDDYEYDESEEPEVDAMGNTIIHSDEDLDTEEKEV